MYFHIVVSSLRRKQDVKIEIFLSLRLVCDHRRLGMNVKGVAIYANCLRSSHRKLFAAELRAYGN